MLARKVAVFIDAENIAAEAAGRIIEEAGRQGTVLERRFYGDFIGQQDPSPWLKAAYGHALTPRQTVGGTTRKNSADIALVIDAIEILCRDEADVFCIVSCDGDFTQLAMRIRQHGKRVVGIGRSEASASFRSACDQFIVIKEIVRKTPVSTAHAERRVLEPDLLRRAFDGKGDGWVQLSELLKSLRAQQPSFDYRAYGYKSFWRLLDESEVELHDKNRVARLKPTDKVRSSLAVVAS